jgi:hypothetical protein
MFERFHNGFRQVQKHLHEHEMSGFCRSLIKVCTLLGCNAPLVVTYISGEHIGTIC